MELQRDVLPNGWAKFSKRPTCRGNKLDRNTQRRTCTKYIICRRKQSRVWSSIELIWFIVGAAITTSGFYWLASLRPIVPPIPTFACKTLRFRKRKHSRKEREKKRTLIARLRNDAEDARIFSAADIFVSREIHRIAISFCAFVSLLSGDSREREGNPVTVCSGIVNIEQHDWCIWFRAQFVWDLRLTCDSRARIHVRLPRLSNVGEKFTLVRWIRV